MAISIKSLGKNFSHNGTEVKVLTEINLKVMDGDFVSLVGPSGCGKSTLLNIIAGLEKAATGEVLIEEQPVQGPGNDRAALNMILEAEKAGLLKTGSTIVEPTSGNSGIGLAMLGAAREYRTILVMPDTMTKERIAILKAYGAEVVLTPGSERMPGSIKKAKEIAAGIPGSFIPNQFENQANPQVHQTTTALEILDQMDGDLDAFVCTAHRRNGNRDRRDS